MACFGDPTLHNDEIGIVNIQLNGLEEILDVLLGMFVTIDEIFRDIRQTEL